MRLDVQAALVRGQLVPGDVEVDDGAIVAVGLPTSARGSIAVPGFVDLQVNGFGGVDFLSASAVDYDIAGAALLEGGVTAYQPTFITAPEHVLLDALRAMPANGSSPRVVGAHVEGPFLSPERLGTHPLAHRRDPDLALLDRVLDAGRVTEFTLAPELPGADALVLRLRERGIVVSAGHTNATAAEAHAAFDLGVSTVSHLFNAMRPFRSRDPGIVGVALTPCLMTARVPLRLPDVSASRAEVGSPTMPFEVAPVPMSRTAVPILVGGPSSSPLTAISPAKACIIGS